MSWICMRSNIDQRYGGRDACIRAVGLTRGVVRAGSRSARYNSGRHLVTPPTHPPPRPPPRRLAASAATELALRLPFPIALRHHLPRATWSRLSDTDTPDDDASSSASEEIDSNAPAPAPVKNSATRRRTAPGCGEWSGNRDAHAEDAQVDGHLAQVAVHRRLRRARRPMRCTTSAAPNRGTAAAACKTPRADVARVPPSSGRWPRPSTARRG